MQTTLTRALTLCAGLALAGMAGAHSGVENPAVMARMEAMKEAQTAFAAIGDMARGRAAFDGTAARTAASAILDVAERTPGLFERPETDPLMEARPILWDEFDRFLALNDAMGAVAAELAVTGFATETALRADLAALGATCKACHDLYRE